VAGVAALALAGFVVPASASAATTTISDATLTWGLSTEAGGPAYAGGCNFLSAGDPGEVPGSAPWTESDGFYAASDGDVSILRPDAEGELQPATWDTRCDKPDGTTLGFGDMSDPTAGSGNVVRLADGSGTVDADGSGTISWHGTFSVVFYGGYTFWTATDPTLTVAADGTATLTATGGGYGASQDGSTAWHQLTPQTITLASLTGVELDADGFTVSPDYLGVAVTGVGQVEETEDNASWWGSFPQDFLEFQGLTGQSTYWTTSGSGRDAAKVASPLTVTYTATAAQTTHPTVTAQVQGGTVSVAGQGFTAVTNPGDAGVYVAIAPSGGLPDVSSPAGMENFLAADWVTPARIVDGAFTSTLTVPAGAAVPGVSYSVYTWQAHAHSNVSQDTETSLGVLVAAAVPPAPPVASTDLGGRATVKKAKAKVTRARLSRTKVAAHAKKKARARVKVTVKAKGVTVRGKVRVVFDKKHAGKKATRKVTAKLRKAKGKAKVTVRAPRLKRGKYTVTVRYQGKKHVITKAKKKAGVLKVTR